jgi:cysteine desulfurase
VPSDTVTFTSGATESNNLAISGTLGQVEAPAPVLAVSKIEHPSILVPAQRHADRGGCLFLFQVGRDGLLLADSLSEGLELKPALVAVMAANNEVGSVQPFEQVADACVASGVRWHLDAVQAFGRIPIKIPAHPFGSASISAHKLGGPKGIGALYAHREVRLLPQLFGGDQERSRRAGTENVAFVVGMGEACRLAREELPARRAQLLLLERAFLSDLDQSGIRSQRHGPSNESQRLPGTISLRLPGIQGELLLMGLDLQGLAVSLGSACSSGSLKPSHVLAAMGVNKVENLETIRVSFGARQSESEAKEAARRVARFVSSQLKS